MTTIAVLAQGMQVSKAKGSPAQVAYSLQSTRQRWAALQGLLAARRVALRAANRRARRAAGLPLQALPYWVTHRKAKARS